MESYIITGIALRIPKSFVLGLSDESAEKRKYLVKKIKKGIYEAVYPFDLKHGEQVSLDPKLLSKDTLRNIQTVKSLEAEKLEAEKLEAESQDQDQNQDPEKKDLKTAPNPFALD